MTFPKSEKHYRYVHHIRYMLVLVCVCVWGLQTELQWLQPASPSRRFWQIWSKSALKAEVSPTSITSWTEPSSRSSGIFFFFKSCSLTIGESLNTAAHANSFLSKNLCKFEFERKQEKSGMGVEWGGGLKKKHTTHSTKAAFWVKEQTVQSAYCIKTATLIWFAATFSQICVVSPPWAHPE